MPPRIACPHCDQTFAVLSAFGTHLIADHSAAIVSAFFAIPDWKEIATKTVAKEACVHLRISDITYCKCMGCPHIVVREGVGRRHQASCTKNQEILTEILKLAKFLKPDEFLNPDIPTSILAIKFAERIQTANATAILPKVPKIPKAPKTKTTKITETTTAKGMAGITVDVSHPKSSQLLLHEAKPTVSIGPDAIESVILPYRPGLYPVRPKHTTHSNTGTGSGMGDIVAPPRHGGKMYSKAKSVITRKGIFYRMPRPEVIRI